MKVVKAFNGFSINDIDEARTFYIDVLGLELLEDPNGMGRSLKLPGGAEVFMYKKDDHVPATYTVLNLEVDDIDAAIDDLTSKGVTFEKYDGMNQDEKGIARGKSANMGPDIAWFKDPAGNILSVLSD